MSNDFNVDELVKLDTHERDMESVKKRLDKLESITKKIENEVNFGDFFSSVIGKSQVAKSRLESSFNDFLWNFSPKTKKNMKKVIDDINKDSTWFRIGYLGQLFIQILLTIIGGLLIAYLTKVFGWLN